MKNQFSFWRLILLILAGMLIFNSVMYVVHIIDFSNISFSKILNTIAGVLLLSFFGLLMTPAPIGLLIYAISIEMLYSKNIINNIWKFSLIGGLIGIFVFFFIYVCLSYIEGGDIIFEPKMYIVIFISHFLTTLLIYYKKL